jgi:hypothetical protein
MPGPQQLDELIRRRCERGHLIQVRHNLVGAEQIVAIVAPPWNLLAVVHDRDSLIQLKLGTFNEV